MLLISAHLHAIVVLGGDLLHLIEPFRGIVVIVEHPQIVRKDIRYARHMRQERLRKRRGVHGKSGIIHIRIQLHQVGPLGHVQALLMPH